MKNERLAIFTFDDNIGYIDGYISTFNTTHAIVYIPESNSLREIPINELIIIGDKLTKDIVNRILRYSISKADMYNLRSGQVFYNTLDKFYHKYAVKVTSQNLDPFYNDSKLSECINYLYTIC